jgi:cell division protein ZapA
MPVRMNSDKNIKVNIFGTDYPLKVSANVEYIKRIAEYVDSKMKEVQAAKPNRPLHQIAILAALNITDELLHQKEMQKKRHINFEDKVKSLTDKLETGIIKDESGPTGM